MPKLNTTKTMCTCKIKSYTVSCVIGLNSIFNWVMLQEIEKKNDRA